MSREKTVVKRKRVYILGGGGREGGCVVIEPCYFGTGEGPQLWRFLSKIVGRELHYGNGGAG